MKSLKPLCSALVIGSFVLAPAALAQGVKIGVIEVQRVVSDSAMGKESLAKLQKAASGKQEEIGKRQKELRDLEQKINEQNKTLSAEALEKLQKDYQGKAVELKRFQDDSQRELEEAQRKELQEFEKKVMPIIDSVAKEQGYELIFNKFQSGLLYAADSVDLTDAVITRFNSQIASAPAKTDAKGDAKADTKAAPKTAPAKK